MSFNPLYAFFPIPDVLPELNEALRQIDDSLRFLEENGVGGGGGGATDLDGLTDVTIAAPSNLQGLIYNSGSGQWENASIAGPVLTVLDDLADVSITAVESQQTLRYNGAEWVNVGPVDLAFTYNVSDQLTDIVGAGIDVDFTYNLDGTLNTVDNQTKVLTFGYSSGLLSSITVT